MNLIENTMYQDDIMKIITHPLPWNKLQNKALLISGATGLVGSFLIDVIMLLNREQGLNCKVYSLGRNEDKAKSRFSYCYESSLFQFISYDINLPFVRNDIGSVDYVLHLASNTHPVAYATDPIGTITTNIIGTQNMLEFACAHHASRCVFASSNEIYGENRGDIEKFEEKYCGYIDCNTIRAGYPESKRCGDKTKRVGYCDSTSNSFLWSNYADERYKSHFPIYL